MRYARQIVERFGMDQSKSVATPIEPRLNLDRNTDEDPADVPYREVIGSLMYLMLGSRPDLCYAVNYLSRFQDKPTQEHWTHVKRILRYVNETLEFGLQYKRSSAPLFGFCDADWASDLNDSRSTSGNVIKVFGNTVSWSSRKQNILAKYTTEAEYISAS